MHRPGNLLPYPYHFALTGPCAAVGRGGFILGLLQLPLLPIPYSLLLSSLVTTPCTVIDRDEGQEK